MFGPTFQAPQPPWWPCSTEDMKVGPKTAHRDMVIGQAVDNKVPLGANPWVPPATLPQPRLVCGCCSPQTPNGDDIKLTANWENGSLVITMTGPKLAHTNHVRMTVLEGGRRYRMSVKLDDIESWRVFEKQERK